jgi:hypothetical protein
LLYAAESRSQPHLRWPATQREKGAVAESLAPRPPITASGAAAGSGGIWSLEVAGDGQLAWRRSAYQRVL